MDKSAEILTTEMQKNDAGAKTVREYLIRLLSKVWDEGECFGGKRPFGNSGWEHEIYAALATAGHITAEFDDEGDLIDCDEESARELIEQAIISLA